MDLRRGDTFNLSLDINFDVMTKDISFDLDKLKLFITLCIQRYLEDSDFVEAFKDVL